MIEWNEAERGAVRHFVETDSLLRAALEKFLASHRNRWREYCAVQMSQVPRNHELASDYASKANAFEEFWGLLLNDLENT